MNDEWTPGPLDLTAVRCFCRDRAVYVLEKGREKIGLCASCAAALRQPETFGWEEAA